MTKPRRLTRFFFVGGRLAIDFANTVRARDSSSDALGSWEDVVAFLKEAEAVDTQEARRLLTLARTKPRLWTAVFARALRLREAVRGVLAALEAGTPLRPRWIAVVNRVLRGGAGYPQLAADGEGWRVTYVARPAHPASVLVPIARSAAELVAVRPVRGGPPVRMVRRCANPQCVLYFYDRSPTGRRRWCSMAVCGNRLKVARFARRRQTTHTGP